MYGVPVDDSRLFMQGESHPQDAHDREFETPEHESCTLLETNKATTFISRNAAKRLNGESIG